METAFKTVIIVMFIVRSDAPLIKIIAIVDVMNVLDSPFILVLQYLTATIYSAQFIMKFSNLFVWAPGEGALEWQEGYQARPWTHKKHPNHVLFRYEKRP